MAVTLRIDPCRQRRRCSGNRQNALAGVLSMCSVILYNGAEPDAQMVRMGRAAALEQPGGRVFLGPGT
jgi:hypothetical protein